MLAFKVDENLPFELVEMLRQHGCDAVSVGEQRMSGRPDQFVAEACDVENRVLVTLDLDFADIVRYPPEVHPGFIVLRLARQDKSSVLTVFRQVLLRLDTESIKGRLWIVGEGRIRIRGGENPANHPPG